MRKFYIIYILIMMVAFTGCTQKQDMDFDPVDNSGYTILEADIESLILDGEDRLWPEDSYIGVYGSEMGDNERYVMKNASAGTKTATFYGPVVKGDVAAYYPYNPSYIGNADGMPMKLDAVQAYTSGYDAVQQFLAYTPRAYGYMHDGKVNFVYPNGVLHITVETYETLLVKKIKINSPSSPLAGLGIFKSNGAFEMTETSQSEVVLDCGEGVLSKIGESYTDFYLVLVPGLYEDLEISIEIDGEAPFGRVLPPIEVQRVSAADFAIASVSVTTSGGPEDFIDTPLEFE